MALADLTQPEVLSQVELPQAELPPLQKVVELVLERLPPLPDGAAREQLLHALLPYLLALLALAALAWLARSLVRPIGKDEQLRLQRLGEASVQNGPGFAFVVPFLHTGAQLVKAETLGALDWVVVRDSNGGERIERGPRLLFLSAYDKIEKRGRAWTLGPTEYVRVEDTSSGKKWVVKGPCLWIPAKAQEEGRKGEGICLGPMEYVKVINKETGDVRIDRGPQIWFPIPHEDPSKCQALTLGPTHFVLVEDTSSGDKSVHRGPLVFFPKAHDKIVGKGEAISLSDEEYIHVEDKLTGKVRLQKGPMLWFPTPFEAASKVRSAVPLQSNQYLKIKCMESGQRWVQRGKALVYLEPTWRIEMTGAPKLFEGIRTAWVLKRYEFVRLVDSITGKVTVHRGEQFVFPGPDEVCADRDKMQAIDLKVNEYVKLEDQATGESRVMPGPDQVWLGPHESAGQKQRAFNVDDQQAILVRDKETGQLRLVTEKKLFVPGPNDIIEKLQEKILLAEHEAIIVKDKDGVFQYHYGSDRGRHSFFLEPYCEVVGLCWSRGPRRATRDLQIERFDCRGQYMAFEFNVRTKDNVELIVEGVIFWQFADIPLMVRTTGDTTGDICNNMRSQFIKHCARASLKEFMDDLTLIAGKVYEEGLEFYKTRGVQVHSLEVTGYSCAEQSTSKVLEQIIQETTNRMNRLSQQESENEVKLFKMQGQIEQQRLMGELLDIQHSHQQDNAKVDGIAESERIAAFVGALKDDVPDLQMRTKLWQGLRKAESLSAVSKSDSKLVYAPKNVKLRIDNKT